MNYYSENEDKRGKIGGAIATVAYLVLLGVLLVAVNFTVDLPVEDTSIMLDLTGEMGRASSNSTASEPKVKSSPQTQPKEEKSLTQDFEEAPEIKQPEKQPKPTTKKEEEVPAEKPREVNKSALFKPRSESKNSAGDAAKAEDKSTGKGGYNGDNKGTGGGGVDSDYKVGNRSIVGSIPIPSTNYGKNKSGKVVIEVFVDANGYVARQPVYRAQGSTTNDNELVRVAIAAAKMARFTRSDNDTPEIGTITYIFKLQ